ncbi:hypothetical protein QL285_028363 [Trifolium repens]|nr:hypothetical protein QL285_028363 [Trifolium repens]
MKESLIEFPGFQIYSHRDELMFRNSITRLQKRAPCPLQIKPYNGTQNSIGNGSTSSSTSLNSFFTSKDPIPLLSPLVVLESTIPIREENTAKSH